MEENIAKMDEIEEIANVDEAEEVSEGSGAGAFVAGIAGGFLAYAVIGGTKKLVEVVGSKIKARKLKKEAAKAVVVDAEIVEDSTEQPDSGEESENK